MKKILIIYFSLLAFAGRSEEYKTDAISVSQTIQYQCENASEVYLVWGLNGWYEPAADELPSGTYISEGLAYSPMIDKEGVFECTLPLKKDQQLDFVFRITRDVYGNELELWDNNLPPFKDYHTLLYNNSTLLIDSPMVLPVANSFSVLNFAGYFLIGAAVISLLLFVLRFKYKHAVKANYKRVIIASSLSFFVLVLFIRPAVAGFGDRIITGPLDFSFWMFPAAYYDFWFIVCLSALFLSVAFFFRRIPALRKGITALFVLACLSSLIIALLNIRIVNLLGKPLNYQWLYYADFLKSSDSRLALSENLSADYLRQLLMISLSFVLLITVFLNLFSMINLSTKQLRFSYLTASCLLGIYVVTARNYISDQKWEYDKLANPVAEFLSSINPLNSSPSLFTMKVHDSLRFSPRRAFSKGKFSKEIKNVLVYVMESVPSEYVSLYDTSFRVTPVLEKYRDHAIIFDNVYAHAPATNLSMVSMLCSVYPWISYTSLTEEYPGIRLHSVVDVLKSKGYKTSFFNSGDNRFQSAGQFLKARGFDEVRDCMDNNETSFNPQQSGWNFMGGKSDSASATALCKWIGSVKNKNWFSVMWTYQTHYPYFLTGAEQRYTGNEDLNRYLNALNNSDKVLGGIINYLEENDLFNSTLIVVVGDHGEAFGRHGQITHARMIYEENLHVPCVFINPSFKQQNIGNIGGLIDVAPTVLEMLGSPSPQAWQGESLMSENKTKRTFFFAPWSDYLFGYREGSFKYIYNATKNTTEIYDLRSDIHEAKNISAEYESSIPVIHQRLAGWAQFVNAHIDSVVSAR